jgi:hypothetical protein
MATTSHGVINICASDALGSSVLECRVHTKRKIGSDDFIGGTKDTIDTLLTEGAVGGVHILIFCLFCS